MTSRTSGSKLIFLRITGFPFTKTDIEIKFKVPVTLTFGNLYRLPLIPFFAEIFIQDNGRIKQAALLAPDNLSEAIAFSDSGYALEMHGGRYPDEIKLEHHYPDGNYIFRYDTPSTGLIEQPIALVNSAAGSSRLPDAPHII